MSIQPKNEPSDVLTKCICNDWEYSTFLTVEILGLVNKREEDTESARDVRLGGTEPEGV